MKKLRILLVRGGAPNGVSYHRLLKPHKVMCKYYEADVHDCDAIEQVSTETINTFDIVIANRTLGSEKSAAKQAEQINRVKSTKAKYILDIDDYWHLPNNHEILKWWRENNMTSLIQLNVDMADYVMVTHDCLGKLTKRDYNVQPNGLDTTALHFNLRLKAVRQTVDFGWCGSSNHIHDINLMAKSLKRLNDEGVKYRMSYLGWSDKMPHAKLYEHILSGYNSIPDNQYINIGGKEVDTYGALYDHIDVSLIPLCDNTFNACKSNLKMLEAGFKKKAVIVSNVHPYTSLINHEVNCLKVNATDNGNGWYKSIKRLINNKELITKLAEQLYQDVQPYELNNLIHNRYKFYQSIL